MSNDSLKKSTMAANKRSHQSSGKMMGSSLTRVSHLHRNLSAPGSLARKRFEAPKEHRPAKLANRAPAFTSESRAVVLAKSATKKFYDRSPIVEGPELLVRTAAYLPIHPSEISLGCRSFSHDLSHKKLQ